MPDQNEHDFWDQLVLHPDAPTQPGNADERIILAIDRLLPSSANPDAGARARRRVFDSNQPNSNAQAISDSVTVRPFARRDTHGGKFGRPFRRRWMALAAGLLLFLSAIGIWSQFRSSLLNGAQDDGGFIPAVSDQPSDIAMRGVNPGRTNVVAGPGPRNAPVVEWEYQAAGVVRTAPILVDGIIYAGQSAMSPQYPGVILALRASDGTLVWTHPTSAGLTAAFALVNATLYAVDDNGNVYALDAATGTERWRIALRGNQPYQFAWYGALLAVDGRLIVSSGSQQAVAASNDAIFVSHPSQEWIEGEPRVSAISLDDGTVLWDVHGYPETSQGGIFALAVDDGELRWIHSSSPSYLGPAYAGGIVYYGEVNPTAMVAVDAATGDEIWRSVVSDGGKWRGIASPAVTGDAVLAGTTSGDLVSVDRHSGKLSWVATVFFVDTDFYVNFPEIPVVGTTAVELENGAIVAVDLTDHSVLWRLRVETDLTVPPVVVNDKIIQVAFDPSDDSSAIVMFGQPPGSP